MAQFKKAIVVVLAMAILFSLSVALSACGNDSELKWRFELNEDGKSYTAVPDQKYSFDEEAYRKYVNKHRDDFQAREKKYAELVEKASKNCNKVTKANVPAEYKGLPVTEVIINFLKNAFSNLKTITVSENSERFAAIDNVLYSKNIDTVYFVLKTLSGEFIIPNSVTSIGDFAFRGCTGLTSITIPNSVTSIGYGAFYGCTGLTSITIPESVTSIGDFAFRGCTGLTSITIPNSVTSIGSGAFYGCTGLTSITIPDSVTSIVNHAFFGCSGLTSIEYDGTIEQWQAIQFEENWDEYTGEYVVHCTDGTVAKDGTVTKK